MQIAFYGSQEIPEKFDFNYEYEIPCNVKLQFPTGCEKNVKYNEKEKCFVETISFMKEVARLSATLIVIHG